MMKKILMVMSVIGMMAVLVSVSACAKTTTTNKTTGATTTLPGTTTNGGTTTNAPTTTVGSATLAPTTTADSKVKAKEDGSMTIKVYDIDDELLDSKVVSFKVGDVFFDLLDANFDVVSYVGDYGTSIVSVAGQITDNNWYSASYENGEYTMTGVDGFEPNDGDVFEFKMECWNTVESGYGTMDSYDVNVDKTLYHYAKTIMKDAIAQDATYTNSNYWNYLIINLMQLNNYSNSVFNAVAATTAFKETLEAVDLTTLSGANWCKYYFAAKAANIIKTEEFSAAFKAYIDDASKFSAAGFSEYVYPFILAVAKDLRLEEYESVKNVIKTDYVASTEWGVDGLGWQVASLAAFNKYTDAAILEKLPIADQGNNVTNAAILMAYAAMGANVRTEEADLIKIMFDGYYDATLNLLKWMPTDTAPVASTNQIYAALAAYKVARDTYAPAFIFA